MPNTDISLTAWIVVVCQMALRRSQKWGALINESAVPFYQSTLYYCSRHSWRLRLLTCLPNAAKLWLIEHLHAKGAAQHYLLRKQAIAKQLTSSLTEGVQQIVVLGGGFDPMAMLNADRHRRLVCIEIDTAAMMRHKMNIAAAIYGALPDNYHDISADLTQSSLYEILSSYEAFSPDKPTLFIAEGISMYLGEETMRRLLADMRRLSKRPVSFIFTAIEQHGKERGREVRQAVLTRTRETFSWSIAREKMNAFLSQNDFMLQYSIPYEALQQHWRTPQEMEQLRRQNGEYLVYAVAKPQA